MDQAVVPAKLKSWCNRNVSACVEGEFIIVLFSCFRDTKMLGKATSNQALSEVKYTYTYTFTLTYTALPRGLKQKTGALSKAPLNC